MLRSVSKTTFLWETPNYFDVDGRGITLADWFGPVATLGGSSFYLAAYFDSTGAPLQGGNDYKLHVSANVPVKQFWSITVYDMATSALFRNADRLVSLLHGQGCAEESGWLGGCLLWPEAARRRRGELDLYRGGQELVPWFRFYGPEKAAEDKSWKMPDIEKVN